MCVCLGKQEGSAEFGAVDIPFLQEHNRNEQLNRLAVILTTIKLLFLQQQIQTCRELCSLVSPLLPAVQPAVHTSHICNEVAFTSCIAMLLEHPQRLVEDRSRHRQPIYLLGDSHCLPGIN